MSHILHNVRAKKQNVRESRGSRIMKKWDSLGQRLEGIKLIWTPRHLARHFPGHRWAGTNIIRTHCHSVAWAGPIPPTAWPRGEGRPRGGARAAQLALPCLVSCQHGYSFPAAKSMRILLVPTTPQKLSVVTVSDLSQEEYGPGIRASSREAKDKSVVPSIPRGDLTFFAKIGTCLAGWYPGLRRPMILGNEITPRNEKYYCNTNFAIERMVKDVFISSTTSSVARFSVPRI